MLGPYHENVGSSVDIVVVGSELSVTMKILLSTTCSTSGRGRADLLFGARRRFGEKRATYLGRD